MSVNKVILIGNVGKDPEVRYLDKNVAVANFPLATTEKGYTMANGTVVPDRTNGKVAQQMLRLVLQILPGKLELPMHQEL